MSNLEVKSKLTRQYDQAAMTRILQEIEMHTNPLLQLYRGLVTGIPTTTDASGAWAKESAPVSGGYFGYVYTATGWKGFGVIA